ncbi:MAG: mechanosensitive ion channel family protein [Muribaculaceae bacterium]|nr:mechanosensitive ion channel family protein [Muribaculaceae bacterium]
MYEITSSVAAPASGELHRFVDITGGRSYRIAEFIMNIVDWILGVLGLSHHPTLVTVLYALVVLGVSLVAGYVAQWIIFAILRQIARRWDGGIYRSLREVRFFDKLCRMVPALVFLILIQFTLSAHNVLSGVLTKVTLVYVVIVTAIALSALVVAVWRHVDARENKRKLPLKGLAQLARGILWIVAAIVIVAILVDKSPATLLAGLGAFAAVLMLVFKDSILGLVAGVQLSENDSLHVGDWIKVNGTDANGTVTEVNLTSVVVLTGTRPQPRCRHTAL